ncbi:hypothetical protein HQ585_17410 [candidate division KSB1 bacterium]|nr:hypothetical protein [candidate division KSB1 bacterium]
MKRWIVLLLITASPLAAQNPVEIFGYFESQLMTAQINSEWIPLASNKLRLDLSGDVSDRIKFAANFNYITYHGKTTWMIADILPESALDEIPESLLPYYQITFENRNFLDNAFVGINLGAMDLTIGKQQLSFGSGYAWNPTDIFNTKDLFDPAYEQPGHNAVRLDWQAGERFAFSSLMSPEDSWEKSTGLLQVKVGISRFDVSFLAARTTQTSHDYTEFDPLTFSLIEDSELRTVYGADVNGEIFGLGVWTEYAYSEMENSDNYYEWLLGADYTFESGTYCMAEFYRNTIGKQNDADYTFNDWLRYLNAKQKALSRDQVYGLIQHPVTDVMNLGLSGIYSISDGSAALLPTLSWTPDPNLEILAYINWLTGEDTQVYNSKLGNGGLIRARVYF